MNAAVTYDLGTILLAVAGFLFVTLISVVGYGIRNALSDLQVAIKELRDKLEATMTKERCTEHHDNHQKQHELEGANHKDQHLQLEKDINGVGSKLQRHIDETKN